MATTIDFGSKVISVPLADLTLIDSDIPLYEQDVDAFRLELKALEQTVEGMGHTATHVHNTIVTLSGVTYARTVEILAPYTVTYEDAQYAVRLVGANHNIADVKNLNQVSLIIGNSGGLIETTIQLPGSGLSAGEKVSLANAEADAASGLAQSQLARKILQNRQEMELVSGAWWLVTYDDGGAELFRNKITDKDGNIITVDAKTPARRGAPA